MHDFFVIGSITLDLFFIEEGLTRKGDRYELAVGGKYVVENFAQRIGGGGANISIGLARQGYSVTFWGMVDKSLLGEYMIQCLKNEGVDISLMEKRNNALSVSAILLSNKGERTIITHHGEGTRRIITKLYEETLRQVKYLVISDSPKNTLEEKLLWAQIAKKDNPKIVTLPTAKECKQGKKNLENLIKVSDWIILNAHELADLLGVSYQQLKPEERNYDMVLNAKGLIVTDGGKGAYAYTNMKRYFQRAVVPIRIIDTTGAGDAFAAGFLAEYTRNEDLKKALLFASKNAASVIANIGAQDGFLKTQITW